MPAPRGDKWETDIEARLRVLEQLIRKPLSGSGLSIPAPDVVQADGEFVVNGELVVDGGEARSGNYVPGTSGWATKGDGSAEFKDITLYDLPNSMLANPVVPAQAFQGTGSFTLSVAGGNIITIHRTVPAGFTSVVVTAGGSIAAINSTASVDALYCAVDVNGAGGNQFGMPVDAGSFGSLSRTYTDVLTGLSAGDSVDAHLYASTGIAGWASNPANGADLSVTYLWFR